MNKAEQEFSLRWNNHENNLCVVLESMLKRGILVDVTLSAEGKSYKVHRAVLSACSPYFEELFMENYNSHPIIILKDVTAVELKSLIDYMYTGQVTVSQSKLSGFLKTAESLKVRGLANALAYQANDKPTLEDVEHCSPPPSRKRKFSVPEIHPPPVPNNISNQNYPTDLSVPKSSSEAYCPPFKHVDSLAPVEYTTPKIYVKPKETLMSPQTSDLSEISSERSSDREMAYPSFYPTDRMTYRQAEPDLYALRDRPHDQGASYMSLSDDEDLDNNDVYENHDGGTGMVRSGVCTVCGCFRSDLRQHMDSHSGQKFQCDQCGRSYPRRKTLNQHVKRSHPLKEAPVVPPADSLPPPAR